MAAPGKRVAKTGNGTPNDQSLGSYNLRISKYVSDKYVNSYFCFADFIPLEASPSPAIRRSGRKKNGRYFNEKLPPPSPASLVARYAQLNPCLIIRWERRAFSGDPSWVDPRFGVALVPGFPKGATVWEVCGEARTWFVEKIVV